MLYDLSENNLCQKVHLILMNDVIKWLILFFFLLKLIVSCIWFIESIRVLFMR